MHALIIEQEAHIAFMIEDALRDSGFLTFAFACSADDAVAAAQKRCPDLITSDVRLGAGTGIDAVRTICSDQPIPVIFITATAWEVRARYPEAIIVQKPFPGAELKRAIAAATAGFAS